MKTLQQFKDEYAKENDFDHWGLFLIQSSSADINIALNIICIDYARESNITLLSALMDLVDLKDLKDNHGITSEYLTKKPKAWDNARMIITKMLE